MSASFSLPSFAKINWTLSVLGKRDDGFHELCTVFQTISLHDTLRFTASDQIVLTCDDESIPTDERNLIVRAARSLIARTEIDRGAAIYLEKRIPSPGGLGGGSSNAAVAMIGLCKLWEIELSEGELSEIAAELGSDVPFFLQGGTALGTGRGEIIEPTSELEADEMLVITPDIVVSTADAFRGLAAPALTAEAQESNLTVCRKEAGSLDPLHSVLRNDFQSTVFAAYPEIERVKKTLIDLGAVNAAMSGSGASVFAIFDKKETRQAAQKALDTESTWDKFAVSTISRNEYSKALGRASY